VPLYRRHNELQQVRYTQQNRDEDFLEKRTIVIKATTI